MTYLTRDSRLLILRVVIFSLLLLSASLIPAGEISGEILCSNDSRAFKKATIEYSSAVSPGDRTTIKIKIETGGEWMFDVNVRVHSSIFQPNEKVKSVRAIPCDGRGGVEQMTFDMKVSDHVEPGHYEIAVTVDYVRPKPGDPGTRLHIVVSKTFTMEVAYIPQRMNIYVVANDIDWELSGDLIESLFPNRQVVRVKPAAKGTYWLRQLRGFIIILGGPDAYDGVGDVVKEILDWTEITALRTPNYYGHIRRSVEGLLYPVTILAGYDRFLTQKAVEDYGNQVKTFIDYYPGPKVVAKTITWYPEGT